MAYKLKGTYVASCACSLLCPCSVDGKPTSPSGKCDGVLAAKLSKGSSLNGTDLGGVSFGLYFFLPSNFSSGNGKMGLIVDGGASEDQAKALERIFTGSEGGMFGEFAPLIAEWAPTERGNVSVAENAATVGGTSIKIDLIVGQDGKPTTVSNTPFGFAPTYRVGRTSGKGKTPYNSFEQSFGETAEFEWA